MPFFCLKAISKKYKVNKTDFYALRNINLSFPRHGLVSIKGKSGSGKSTLLNILMGLEKPDCGEVLYQDKKINKMSKTDFSKYHLYDISMVYQHYNLFDELTPLENVMLPLLIRGEKKKDASEEVKELFQKFNLLYLLDQKTSTLSGGEKQRIAILRSLVINPKIILADEPTGALDSKNGVLVMDMFKEISKDKLIVMVSHNDEYVEKYSDRIIELKDGEIISDSGLNIIKDYSFETPIKKRYSTKWKKLFLKSNFKNHQKKNVFAFITNFFGFLAIIISIGFSIGSKESEDEALKSNLSIMNALISEELVVKIENSPLNYVKKSRPNLEDIDELVSSRVDALIKNNFNYLFSQYPEIIYERNVVDSAEFVPIYSFDNVVVSNILSYGRVPKDNIDEVLINEEFAKTFGVDYAKLLNKTIVVSSSADVSYETGDPSNPIIKDTFTYSYEMKITGIVKEFAFLNTPKIYYSYLGLEEELQNTYMDNLSRYLKKNVSFYDYIDISENDKAPTSYSYYLFVDTYEKVDKLFDLIEELNENEEDNKIVIESTSYDIFTTYSDFMNTFSSALYVFLVVAFLGVNFIIGMLALSSFIEQKKESAILTCLGARDSTISSIFLEENYLLIFLAIILAIGVSFPLEMVLNKLFYQTFMLENLIRIPIMSFLGFPFIFAPLLCLVAILVSTIFVAVPLGIYKTKSVVEELRDE